MILGMYNVKFHGEYSYIKRINENRNVRCIANRISQEIIQDLVDEIIN